MVPLAEDETVSRVEVLSGACGWGFLVGVVGEGRDWGFLVLLKGNISGVTWGFCGRVLRVGGM